MNSSILVTMLYDKFEVTESIPVFCVTNSYKWQKPHFVCSDSWKTSVNFSGLLEVLYQQEFMLLFHCYTLLHHPTIDLNTLTYIIIYNICVYKLRLQFHTIYLFDMYACACVCMYLHIANQWGHDSQSLDI